MIKLTLPKVIAHRGASAYAPENTLAAFAKAKALGATWVEFDVMLSKCQTPVIIHDETLNRTTNGAGLVADFTYQELEKLDAGSWYQQEFQGQKISTLVETLAFLQKENLCANVEIKATTEQADLAILKIITILNQYWPNSLSPLLLSTFSLPLLAKIRAFSPTAVLGLLMDSWLENWPSIAKDLNCLSIHVNHLLLTPKRVQEIKQANKYVLCYTINDPSRADELFAWGVDSVFSDYPDLLSRNSY